MGHNQICCSERLLWLHRVISVAALVREEAIATVQAIEYDSLE